MGALMGERSRAASRARGAWARASVLVVSVVALATVSLAPAARAATPRAKVDANAVLKVGIPFFIGTPTFNLDPRISVTANENTWDWALYAPLVRFTASTGKYTPYLAQSVTVIDPANVKVAIRADAMFDNGQPVTAADAKATLESMVANQKAGRAGGLNAAIALVQSVEVNDTKTFTIHFTGPALGVVFELLAGREGIVVPASATGTQNTQPVGNGPFKFTSLTSGQKLVTERSSTFFDAKKIKLKGVEFHNVAEGAPQMNALLAGDIDLTAGSVSGGLDFTSFQALSKNRDFKALTWAGTGYSYFDMCRASGYLFNDVRVRQAIQYGTDRAALAQSVYGDKSYAASQFWAKGTSYYDPSIEKDYGYNPTKAKKLLAQAGVAPGTTVTYLINPAADATSSPMALLMKQQWEKIGLNLVISQTENQVTDFYVPASAKPPTVKYQSTQVTFTRAPSAKLSLVFTPNVQRNACNFVDEQITGPMTELLGLSPTSAQAVATWKKVDRYVASIAAVIPLLIRPIFTGTNSRVLGASSDTLGPVGLVGIQYDKIAIKAKR